MIIPCGISDKGVTSMNAVLGKPVGLKEVKGKLTWHYGKIFDREPKMIKLEDLPWS